MMSSDPRDAIKMALLEAEGSGRVEYKRSVRWPSENDCPKIQKVLMRLANANAERGGYIELGREDDGTRSGIQDARQQPVMEREIAAAEQTLVAFARRLDPPMQIRWHRLIWDDGKETIAVEVPGRHRGEWYQGEDGISWMGSASHSQVARQRLLKIWAMEDTALITERHRHEDVRPILEATVRWEDGFTADNGEQFGITIIVDVSLLNDQLARNVRVALMREGEQGFIYLGLNDSPTMSPIESMDTRRSASRRFALQDPIFQHGDEYHLVVFATDALGWEWRQVSDMPFIVMKAGRIPMGLPELNNADDGGR